jgi:hypothetical protein
MLSATFIAIFYIPLSFVLVSQLFKKKAQEPAPAEAADPKEGQP